MTEVLTGSGGGGDIGFEFFFAYANFGMKRFCYDKKANGMYEKCIVADPNLNKVSSGNFFDRNML
jgi:hypothetical protein